MTLKLISTGSTALAVQENAAVDKALLLFPLPTVIECEREDACSYFFRLCKQLDGDFLERRNIACLFDVAGGWLPGPVCRTVGLMVAALVIDVVTRARARPKDGAITIKLHRREDVWACSVTDIGLYAVRSHPPRVPESVLRMAQALDARLVHEGTTDGSTTAFMFDADPKSSIDVRPQ